MPPNPASEEEARDGTGGIFQIIRSRTGVLSTRNDFSEQAELLKADDPGTADVRAMDCSSKQLESAKKNFDKRSVSFFQRCRFPEHTERLKLKA